MAAEAEAVVGSAAGRVEAHSGRLEVVDVEAAVVSISAVGTIATTLAGDTRVHTCTVEAAVLLVLFSPWSLLYSS